MFKRRKPDEGPGATASPQASPGGASAAGDKLEVGMPSPSPFNPPARAGDPDVGMPSLRPVPKEAPAMGRTPYSPQPNRSHRARAHLVVELAQMPGASTPGTPSPRPGASRPGMQPARRASRPSGARLVVGRGISVQGTVQDAERLVVEGTVEASMIHATELSIAQGGVFKGTVEVEEAEIAGTIDGTLTARGNLIVRATGKLLGTANYRRLQVEDGGQIVGELKMITEPGRADAGRAPAEIGRRLRSGAPTRSPLPLAGEGRARAVLPTPRSASASSCPASSHRRAASRRSAP